MDTKQRLQETYDKIAQEYGEQYFDPFWVEEFATYTKSIDGNNVIDLGCGAGRDAAIFVENGFTYTGIDLSAGMLSEARKRVPQGIFEQMDFSRTSFSDNAFDGFWAAASFLHIPKEELAGVLQEARRITKRGGIGFVSVKEKNELDEGMVHEEKYGGIERYFSFYTQEEFRETLEQNGFSVFKMTSHREERNQKTNWLCFFVKVSP